MDRTMSAPLPTHRPAPRAGTCPPGIVDASVTSFFDMWSSVVRHTTDYWCGLVEREHARTLISYDPNLRFNVEPDRAKWRAMLDFMLPRTHLLKISDEDLERRILEALNRLGVAPPATGGRKK